MVGGVRKSPTRYVEAKFWRILMIWKTYIFLLSVWHQRLYSFHYYLVLKVYPTSLRKFVLEMKAALELEKPIRESLRLWEKFENHWNTGNNGEDSENSVKEIFLKATQLLKSQQDWQIAECVRWMKRKSRIPMFFLAWVCFTTITIWKALGKKDLILSLSVRNEVNFKYTEFEMSVNIQKKLFLRQSNIKIGQ